MKKLTIIAILFVVLSLVFTGCVKKANLEQNLIPDDETKEEQSEVVQTETPTENDQPPANGENPVVKSGDSTSSNQVKSSPTPNNTSGEKNDTQPKPPVSAGGGEEGSVMAQTDLTGIIKEIKKVAGKDVFIVSVLGAIPSTQADGGGQPMMGLTGQDVGVLIPDNVKMVGLLQENGKLVEKAKAFSEVKTGDHVMIRYTDREKGFFDKIIVIDQKEIAQKED